MNNVGVWFAVAGICVSVFVIFVCVRFLLYLAYKRADRRADRKRMNKAIDKVMHRYCVNKLVRFEDRGDE